MDPDTFLERVFGLEPEAFLRRMPGRETFAWPGGAPWIVKRTRGGEARDFWYDALHEGPRSSARREAENLAGLAALGLRVPRAVAWVEEPAARRHPRHGGRSALVLERLGSAGRALDLRRVLGRADAAERRRWGAALLAQVVRLHAERDGWIHRDLYLQHVLVDAQAGPAGEPSCLALIDAGRARPRRACPGTRWLVKDLAALELSAPARVTRPERLRFLVGWLRAQGLDRRAARRRWARRIARKADRLGAHRPKHLDPADPADAELLSPTAGGSEP